MTNTNTPAEKDFLRYLMQNNVRMAISTGLEKRAWFASKDAVQEAIRLAKAAGHVKARANSRLDRFAPDGSRQFAFTT